MNTLTCSYTEMKVWPGRGSRQVSKDGRVYLFISHKAKCMHNQRVKPVKLTWTQAWRRLNKKGKAEAVKKRRVRRKVVAQKAIVGASLDEIRKRREEKPETRAAQRQQAMKEIKERQKKKAAQAQKYEKKAKQSRR